MTSVPGKSSRNYANAGVPVDGVTFAGIAPKGAWLLDTSNAQPYQNTGTQASPVWTLRSGGGSSIDGLSSDLEHGIDVVGAGTFGGGVHVPDDAFGSFIAGLDGLVLGTGSPSWTSGIGDVTGPDSYWGANYCVHVISWTPTVSGQVRWPYPPFDATTPGVEFDLFPGPGSAIPTSSDSSLTTSSASIADATNPFPRMRGGSWPTVDAGTPYRIVVVLWPLNSDSSNPPPTGVTVDLTSLIQATEVLGGQASPLTVTRATGVDAEAHGWATASGDYSRAAGERVTASSVGSVAEQADTQAQGTLSSARGVGCAALGFAASAEGVECIAQGDQSHAEGNASSAVGDNSHAEGKSTAIGADSHAEGLGTIARGAQAHVEGQASESNGTQSHAQNHGSIADADYSTAMGHRSHTTNRAQVAMATDRFDNLEGTAQYSTHTPLISTTDATPTPLSLGADRVDLPTNQTWQVIVQVTGSRKDTPGTVAGWVIRGLATNVGGSLRLVGALDTINWHDAGAAAWVATLDVSAGHLDVLVTGVAAQTIYWHAAIHASQVGV